MRHQPLFIILFITLSLPINDLSAETIILKSGETINGKIVSKSDGLIAIKTDEGVRVYTTDAIEGAEDLKPVEEAPGAQAPDSDKDKPSEESVNIPVNQLIDLNGLTRKEILDIRKRYVHEVTSLSPHNYRPSNAVFGKIVDRKPWWGVLGIYYYGPGERSIEGPSYYSQFIINPYLLAGFTTPAYVVKGSSLPAKDLTPMPLELIWDNNNSRGKVSYNISDFYHECSSSFHCPEFTLNLELINARDFGYKFFAIDQARSSGIKATFDKVIPIVQYIHLGSSCGYPGGCNNRSPALSDLNFMTTELPARVYLKLWKGKVNDINQLSDMDFIIDLN